jgi:hypothetical protein
MSKRSEKKFTQSRQRLMHPDSEQLESIQTKIFASEPFQHSKSCKALLHYLIDCSKDGITPKETTIAAEVFNKDQKFHPGEDPVVRVNIHNLRKRLIEYYNSEGKDDKYRIEIPKGKYVVRLFETRPNKTPSTNPPQNKRYWFDYRYYLIIILAFLVVALSLKYLDLSRELDKYNIVDKGDAIWRSFLDGKKETVIVCGDHFFYNIKSGIDKRSIHIRDTWINSPQDLQYLRFPPSEYEIRPTEQTYFPHASIWTLPGVVKVLNSSPRQVLIRPSSQITPTLIEEKNIVYIGLIKSLGILSHFLTPANLNYDIRERLLFNRTGTDTIVFRTESNEGDFHRDYALIMKWRGPRENSFIIIASFFTIGGKEAARYMTEAPLLKIVETKLQEACGYVPENFKIIMEVTGYHQAVTESNFILVESLDAQTFQNPLVDTSFNN